MNIVAATTSYERWLAERVPLIRSDVAEKHELMAASPFTMLRATFYRFLEQFLEICPDLAKTSRILAVGDLHLENFGTWRDAEGRLVWGINDFDEAASLPWTIDLVRLASSAILAADAGGLTLTPRQVCDQLLEGYRDGLEGGGRPFVLAEHNGWLRDVANDQLRDAKKYWQKLSALPAVGNVPSAVRTDFARSLPERGLRYRVVRRRAGVGSRGRPRFVALAEWHGGFIAREAKALAPSALSWLDRRSSAHVHYEEIMARSVRCPDPFFRVGAKWIFRRLAPDCSKIDLADLPERSAAEVVVAMGAETANVHLGSRAGLKAIRRELRGLGNGWLLDSARALADATRHDWKRWREARAD